MEPVTQQGPAASLAAERIKAVRDSAAHRYRLAAGFYRLAGDGRRLFGRAELSFLRWEIVRGVMDPTSGSPWWRAVNERLLHDKTEADLLCHGAVGEPSARSVELWIEFLRSPSPARWYRAHNGSILAGYLDHVALTEGELPAERFMMNVALLRVMYAHALAAEPRLALGMFAFAGRLLGDPRRGTVGLFLDLQRVFPQHYPLHGRVLEELIAAERPLARALDYGIIRSRISELYHFAADSLDLPGIAELVDDGTPCYAWPASRRSVWLDDTTSRLSRLAAFATKSQRLVLRRPAPALHAANGSTGSTGPARPTRSARPARSRAD
jgi:hypothetical protein